MEKFNDVYSKRLTDFFEKCLNKVDSIPDDMSSIFIPGVGENYFNSEKKVLFIGIDNNGWFKLKEEVKKYANAQDKQETIKQYLGIASEKLENLCHAKTGNEKEGWYNGNSKFWEFIMKFQMKLRKPDFELRKLEQCLKDDQIENYRTDLTSFAWGNCNAIQLNRNSDFNENDYNSITELSSQFNHLSIMTEALNPDVVIILNWGEEEKFIQPLNDAGIYKCKKEERVGVGKVKVYSYEAEDSKLPPVIWTYHPQGMARANEGDINSVVEHILNLDIIKGNNK